MLSPLGLIAGNGLFPFLTARGARAQGLRVVAVGFPEETDPSLAREVDVLHWARVGQLGKLTKILKSAGVARAVLCGQVRHTHVFRARPDLTALRLAWSLPDTRTDTLLAAFAGELLRHGVRLMDSTAYVREHLASAGVLTRRTPDAAARRDIELGWKVAKAVAGLDIGQTVVVRKGSVVAVESVEGTDEAIRRGATWAGPGVVAVKVAKPRQDMRFDVPVVGVGTIQALREAKASALALEAGRTLLLDRTAVLAAADKAKIAVVGR